MPKGSDLFVAALENEGVDRVTSKRRLSWQPLMGDLQAGPASASPHSDLVR